MILIEHGNHAYFGANNMGKCFKQVNLADVVGCVGVVSEVSHELIGLCGRRLSVHQVGLRILQLTGFEPYRLELGDNGSVLLTSGRYPDEIFACVEVGQEVSDRLW